MYGVVNTITDSEVLFAIRQFKTRPLLFKESSETLLHVACCIDKIILSHGVQVTTDEMNCRVCDG